MDKIYYTPNHPASFGGVQRLYEAVKSRGIKKQEVEDFLAAQPAYTQLKPVIRKFKRNRTIAYYKNEIFQADLMDVRNLSIFNKGINYILICIDVLSRKLYVEPLKDKTGLVVAQALKKIIGNKPLKYLHTDKGLEFFNVHVQRVLQQKNIKLYSTESDIKCSICERVIRTIRGRLARYMIYSESQEYLSVLQKLVDAYNRAKHRTLGMAPNAVTNKKIQQQVFERLYGTVKKKSPTLKVGDKVLLSKVPKTFVRGSRQGQWTSEVFVVSRVLTSQDRPMYRVTDNQGEELQGRFYAEELQRVL
jgi:hypothetical protein